MSIPFEEIVDEYRLRREAMGSLFNYMREARDHFNGDIAVPLPELEADERPAVANLMSQGLDQTAMRVASVLPEIHYPPLRPGKDTGEGSEEWARKRRLATTGWWQESKINLKMRRMARWVIGYATAPMMVRPNFTTGIPEYALRDPLSTFPSLNTDYDDEQPANFIYAYQRSFAWLEANYPDSAQRIVARHRARPKPSAIIELLEYIDANERVLGVLAMRPAQTSGSMWIPSTFHSDWSQASGEELLRTPNRAEVCWGVSAKRITVDRLVGQFNQVFGIYQQQAKLMALESIAVEKAIFPDIVIQGTTPGRTPILVNGEWADGRTGDVNLVRDGNVNVQQLNPGFMTQPLIDRHERNIRQAGVPSQFSGETPTGIATGRMGDQTLSASVDYPIQEYQEILAETLFEANRRAVAIARGYFGEERKTFHVGFNGENSQADYKPNTHFETDAHQVKYAAPGADINSLVVGIGQRVGIGTMSRWTAIQQDPMVPDAEFEYRKVNSERIQSALLDFVSQSVASGALDPQDVVLLWEEIEKGANISEAWKKAQDAAQERQAEAQREAQQAGGMGLPGEGGGEEAMPGLSMEGPEGPEAGAAIQGPNPSQQNLAQLLGSLRQPQMQTSPLAGDRNAPNVPIGG